MCERQEGRVIHKCMVEYWPSWSKTWNIQGTEHVTSHSNHYLMIFHCEVSTNLSIKFHVVTESTLATLLASIHQPVAESASKVQNTQL